MAQILLKLRIFIFKNFSNTGTHFESGNRSSKNLENSKINPDKFHTKWPKFDENYGSLFSKTPKIIFKILKTSQISEIIIKIQK